LPFLVLAIHILTRRDCYGDAAAVERHLRDFPYERELAVWQGVAESGEDPESIKKEKGSFDSVRLPHSTSLRASAEEDDGQKKRGTSGVTRCAK
jgi:hypothetical protein